MEGAVKHFSCLWVASLVCAVAATGCGLVLDTQPRSTRVDSGMGEVDGGAQDGDLTECTTDDECQNGNVCDGRETCADGQCVGTDAILNCQDEQDCTVDSCDPLLGCVFTPDDSRCTNGSCFEDVGCSATYPCAVPSDCGRQDACLGLFTCEQNVCQRQAPLTCESDGCLVGTCRNSTCVYVPDSSRCPGNGTCLESTCQADGECSPLTPNDERCDDGVDCTVDTCLTLSQAGFCDHAPDHSFCDDGVECTYNFCAPDDPTADVVGGGCAMRLVDSICADQGGFDGCVTPVCLPSGCDDGVVVHPCAEGGICDIDSGNCEFPDGCDACADLANPCAPTTCDANQILCLASLTDPCATTLPGVIGFCDTSGSEPRCAFRPNPQTLPPVSIGLPAAP